ncbi:MAG: polysaccharide pyruvyl transferase family protein [Gammaproteobacteria bacterium]|nr:polysaccharide pyruvyl transferase family protein [Gammaproteobacteria bacterium]MCF6230054.1 polysaccharide pyruvyl transferase family protein [Gammaproteobacteria bacterium]
MSTSRCKRNNLNSNDHSHSMPKLPTILFSTTQQFNPGDEVILMGIERLLAAAGIRYQKRVYDRNPAHKQQRIDALSSAHPQAIDYVIFAGTPEWCSEFPSLGDLLKGPYSARFLARILRLRQTDRSNDPLLRYIIKQRIHCAFLGVGSSKPPVATQKIDQILRQLTELFIVRDQQTASCFTPYQPQQAPCPAFFCSDQTAPRHSLNKIGITLQAPHSNLIRMNRSGFEYAINTFHKVRQHFANVELICHSKKDAEYLKTVAADTKINTISSGESLLETYQQFDAILSTRLHGCVAACSLGLPTFQLWHGLRMSTLKQLPVDNREGGACAIKWLESMDIAAHSQAILDQKQLAFRYYLTQMESLKQLRTRVEM